MGKVIRDDGVNVMNTVSSGNAGLTSLKARVLLIEEDDDPLRKINIVFRCSATVYNKKTSSYTMAAECVSARLDSMRFAGTLLGSSAIAVPAASATVPANSNETFEKDDPIGTFSRGAEPTTFSGTITLTYPNNTGGTSTKTKEISLVFPPLKQNVVDDASRITYTVNNVKYDILNYK